MYMNWKLSLSSNMSNPSRQINTRRLPPLPSVGAKRGNSPQSKTSVAHGHFGRPNPLSPKPNDKASQDEMMITGRTLAGSGGSFTSRHTGSTCERHISSYDLNPDVVSTYLHDNPEFLDKYVLSHVSQDHLERLLQKKTNQHKNRLKNGTNPDHGTANGDSWPQHQRDNISKWKCSVHGEKRKMLQELCRDLHQHHSKAQVLSELTACIAAAINADGFNLYLTDDSGQEVYYYKPNTNSSKSSSVCCRRIGEGTIVSAYVAHTMEGVRLQDLIEDERFPEGLGVGGDTVQCVLAQPVLQSSGELVGVIEVYRKMGSAPFTEEDEQIASSLVVWGALTVYYAEMYHNIVKQRKLNEFLLTVTKSIFQDIVSMDTVIMKIMNYAKKLVSADRTALFLVDSRTKELYARVFDMGDDVEQDSTALPQIQKEIRFPMDKGVAGHVASTGEVLNITDAYADNRFNREVDLQTGYTTKTILCMPIYIRGNVIGVVQMVNKLNGVFTKADEESFETFSIYCGLALHHAKLYEKIRRSEQKYKVALEVLSYHSQAPEDEITKLRTLKMPQNIPALTGYHFSPWAVSNEEKPLYVIYMFRDLFNLTSNNAKEQRFDMNHLYKFTLTVRKNYRNVPYHNWAHAFSVAHAMFTVIKTTGTIFSPIECLALFVGCLCHDLDHRGKTNSYMVKYSSSPLAAIYSTSVMEHHHFNQTVAILQCLGLYVACLCHDVDHRGYNNQFMVQSASPLAAIYSTSTMEHHHFNHTITILQQDGHNIFKHLTSEEYKQVLGDIKHCILATDLALFFGNRARLRELVDKGELDWNSKDHRRLVYAIAMTACDLCVSAKPWDIQIDPVMSIFEEFYAQGDEERTRGTTPIPMMDRHKQDQLPSSQGDAEKAVGRTPNPMMDREKHDELPKLEVGFLVGICLPCYELLAQVLPETKPMVDGARNNLQRWQELAEANKLKQEAEEAEGKAASSDKGHSKVIAEKAQ